MSLGGKDRYLRPERVSLTARSKSDVSSAIAKLCGSGDAMPSATRRAGRNGSIFSDVVEVKGMRDNVPSSRPTRVVPSPLIAAATNAPMPALTVRGSPALSLITSAPCAKHGRTTRSAAARTRSPQLASSRWPSGRRSYGSNASTTRRSFSAVKSARTRRVVGSTVKEPRPIPVRNSRRPGSVWVASTVPLAGSTQRSLVAPAVSSAT